MPANLECLGNKSKLNWIWIDRNRKGVTHQGEGSLLLDILGKLSGRARFAPGLANLRFLFFSVCFL